MLPVLRFDKLFLLIFESNNVIFRMRRGRKIIIQTITRDFGRNFFHPQVISDVHSLEKKKQFWFRLNVYFLTKTLFFYHLEVYFRIMCDFFEM